MGHRKLNAVKLWNFCESNWVVSSTVLYFGPFCRQEQSVPLVIGMLQNIVCVHKLP